MNALLWIFQILLALHTALGALWKFTNPAPVAGLQSLPPGVWMALGVVGLLCSLGLILPFVKRLGFLAPIAAGFVALEMLVYIAADAVAGSLAANQAVYWAVVAAFSLLVVIGRIARPIR